MNYSLGNYKERNMVYLNTAFILAKEPQIEPSAASGYAREGAFLAFKGTEALALAQFCLHQKEKPVLVIECERGPGKGPHIYEGVEIISLAHEEGHVLATTNLGVLYFDAAKTSDPDGHCITTIETLPKYFPMQDYRSFRQELLQQASSTAPRATPT
jgi:hypothetical protein